MPAAVKSQHPKLVSPRIFKSTVGRNEELLALVYDATLNETTAEVLKPVIEILTEDTSKSLEFEAEVHRHLAPSANALGPHILVGLVRSEFTLSRLRGMGLIAAELDSCFFSGLRETPTGLIHEIYYNLRWDVVFTEAPSGRVVETEADIGLHHLRQPIYHRYDFSTGKSTYLISVVDGGVVLDPLVDLNHYGIASSAVHPFSVHLRLLESAAKFRTPEIQQIFCMMLPLEESLLFDKSIGMSPPEEVKKQLQSLHNNLRWMIIYYNYNDRSLSTAKNLLREADRLYDRAKRQTSHVWLDDALHERVKDGLLCFQDFCEDRARRLLDRRERAQNLISLLYNLMQNRDSTTNLSIAADSALIGRESAKIAKEAKRDSAAMKTIAVLTMAFLPATFVSTVFSANLFSFESGSGAAWRVYLAAALPLTAVTLFIWTGWMKWRALHPVKDEEKRVG